MASVHSERALPMENIDEFLRQHYGRNVLHAYRSVQKFYVHLKSVQLDIQILL